MLFDVKFKSCNFKMLPSRLKIKFIFSKLFFFIKSIFPFLNNPLILKSCFIFPFLSKFNSKSAIKFPDLINCSKKNSSELEFVVLINESKSLNKIDLVDIFKFVDTNFFLIRAINETLIFTYLSSITFSLNRIFVPIVFALTLKFNGSKVNFIFSN